MQSPFFKSRLFASIALVLLLYAFTIPSVLFHGTLERIEDQKSAQIPSYVYGLWNHYQSGRYFSHSAPKEAQNDLKKMIEMQAEIGVASAPIWYVSLEAPNYPKDAFPEGIPVYYHFDGFSGEVHEMNTINHYIGMDPMERGAPHLRAFAPYVLVLLSFALLLFILYPIKVLSLAPLTAALLPGIFLGFYAYWLYWFGHNMHDYGAFKIKPFMPTVFGDGKVAQFTTHSYPDAGFWFLAAIAVFCLLALLSRAKAFKTLEAAK